jgi:hypothetical protein
MRKLYILILIILLSISLSYSQTKIGGTAKVGGKTNVGVATVGSGGDFVFDTFTASSDVNLSSHTGETGATWTLHPSYSGIITNDATLDRIYLTSAGAGGYIASGTPPSANYCASMDFQLVTFASANYSVIVRFDETVDTGILLRFNVDLSRWEVLDRVTGSNGSPVTSTTNVPIAGGSAVTGKICASGTSVTAFTNGVQDTSLNFTTAITSTGKAGIRFSGTATSTSGLHVDNFHAQ